MAKSAMLAVNAKRSGVKLADYASQNELFAGDDRLTDDDVQAIVEVFIDNARSAKRMTEILGVAADFAHSEANKPAEDLFGAAPHATCADVINRIREENHRYDAAKQNNGQLFDDSELAAPAARKEGHARYEFQENQDLEELGGTKSAEENVQRPADRAAADERGQADARGAEVERSEARKSVTADGGRRPGRTEAVRSSLRADEDIGHSFGKLEEAGVVKVVDSIDNLPADLRTRLDEADKSVSASSNEISSDLSDMKAIRKEVLQKIRQKLNTSGYKNVRIRSDGENVQISFSGAKHTLHYHGQGWKDALALLHVRDLIEESERMSSESDKHSRKDGLVIKHYRATIEINGTAHPVRIVIREATDGVNRFYHLEVDRNNPEATRATEIRNRSLSTPRIGTNPDIPSSGTKNSLDANIIVVKRSENGVVQAVYDTRTGKAYIIAANVKPSDEKTVFLHEVGVHMATDKLGQTWMRPLIARALQIVRNGHKNGDKIALRAYQRLQDAGLIDKNGNVKEGFEDEAFAYLADEVANDPRRDHPACILCRRPEGLHQAPRAGGREARQKRLRGAVKR